MTEEFDASRYLNRDELPDPIVSDNALTVMKDRYMAKGAKGELLEDAKGMYMRVAAAIAQAEKTEEDKKKWAKEFYFIMSQGLFVPNSPTIMNAGRELGMLSACFVLPVEDDLEKILKTQEAVALVQRAGGGTGFNFSELRPNGSIVKSSGGTTAGPLSFIDMYSATTSAIQQGAFRRGANMAIMNIDHPDIISFINAKEDMSRWQNYNVSIGMTDEFMEWLDAAPDAPHRVTHPKWGSGQLYLMEDGSVKALKEGDEPNARRTWTVQDTWDLICTRAWSTGEPGLFFVDTTNKHNPLLNNIGPITATNPCGEQPLHSEDSCNLGSINLSKFYDDEDFNEYEFRKVVKIATRFLDNVVEMNRYPTPGIEKMSKTTRRIGLGVMGWADLLFQMGTAYDSDDGRYLAGYVGRVLDDESMQASMGLAKERGVPDGWKGSEYERKSLEVRNMFRTTIAPTGTISIIANCSGGIEPLFALAFTRRVMPDGDGVFKVMTEFNPHFKKAVEESELGLTTQRNLLDYALEHGHIGDFRDSNMAPSELNIVNELKKVFVTTHEIKPQDHVEMQATWQANIDSAVSKTINLSREATPEDVSDAYQEAHALGCKGITVYRDGCRDNVAGMQQPMSLRKEEEAPVEESVLIATAAPVQFDDMFRLSYRMKVPTQWGNLHLFVVLEEDKEVEIFAQLGKAGDLMAADIEGMCRLASVLLRSGGTLDDVISQLEDIGSTHVGVPGRLGKITSVPDAIAKGLKEYKAKKAPIILTEQRVEEKPVLEAKDSAGSIQVTNARDKFDSAYGSKCPSCGAKALVHQEGCKKCQSCSYSAC